MRHREADEGGDRRAGGGLWNASRREAVVCDSADCRPVTGRIQSKCATRERHNCCSNSPSRAAVRRGCRRATCPTAARRAAARRGAWPTQPPPLPEVGRARRGPALRQSLDAEHVDRHALLSARLVHDEVQPQAERAAGGAAGHGRPAPVSARGHAAGHAGAALRAAADAGRDRRACRRCRCSRRRVRRAS